LTRDIKRQLGDLPGNIKAMARQQIAGLIDNPHPPRSKELVGHVGHYRLCSARNIGLYGRCGKTIVLLKSSMSVQKRLICMNSWVWKT
jgi:hypothetical protein